MKRIYLLSTILLFTIAATAQDSSYKSEPDTVHVGNFMIIKKGKNNTGDSVVKEDHYQIDIYKSHRKYSYNYEHPEGYVPRKKVFSTNWFIFDLGFANYNDRTAYGSPEVNTFFQGNTGKEFEKSDLKLTTGKSSNVNIWLLMQKLNISKQVLNLKYGLGLNMYNFRFKNNITYKDDPVTIIRDSIDFSKNKLYAGYATIPLMINLTPTPDKYRGFSISAGVSAGYRIGSHTKQKSDEFGKVKNRDDFNLNPWMFAYVGEIGVGPVRLYGSYSINPLHDDALKQYPYTVGVRFSNW